MKDLNLRELNGVKRLTGLMTIVLLSAIEMGNSKEQEKLDNSFKWRCKDSGRLVKPKYMHYKHLFYTWLMIWNHAVPTNYTIWWNYKYVFDDYYTNEYMQAAFGAIYREIKKRTDYGYKMLGVIRDIENFISKHPELEEIKIK
jgi:hypothetical protein